MQILLQHIWLAIASLLCHSILAAPLAPLTHRQPARTINATATFRVIGLGVTSRTAASNWYARTLGVQHLISLPVSLGGYNAYTPFDEDLASPGGLRAVGSGILMALMQWTPRVPPRSVRDLPVLLRFTVPDARAARARVLAEGGLVWAGEANGTTTTTTTTTEGALYARDLDGYLLEFVQTEESARGNWTSLSAVGVGVADLAATSQWFAQTMGAQASAVRSSAAWDRVAMSGSEGCELAFMDWHETPKRATYDLPIKLVMLSWSPLGYLDQVVRAGGKLLWSLGFIGFAESPHDKIMIEVN